MLKAITNKHGYDTVGNENQMSCKAHIFCGNEVEIYTECVYPDTINFVAPLEIEDGVSSEFDELDNSCIVSIEIGSEPYKKLEKYFKSI